MNTRARYRTGGHDDYETNAKCAKSMKWGGDIGRQWVFGPRFVILRPLGRFVDFHIGITAAGGKAHRHSECP